MKRTYENMGGQGGRRSQDLHGRGRDVGRHDGNRGGRGPPSRGGYHGYQGRGRQDDQSGFYGPTGGMDPYQQYDTDPYRQGFYGGDFQGATFGRYGGSSVGYGGRDHGYRGGGSRGRGRDFSDSHGGRGRSYGDHHQGGRGRGGGRPGGRGRGRGRGGRESRPDFQGISSVLTNIVPANVTEGFQFFLYTIDCKDASALQIESRHRRRYLFNLGVWDGLLKDMPEKEKDDLRKVVFFSGGFFFSARVIPGAEPDKLPMDLPLDDKADGDTMRVVKLEHYTAPQEFTTSIDQVGSDQIKVDKRCADCTRAFVDIGSLLQHCQNAGHKPVFVTDDMEDGSAMTSNPAQLPVFISYANMILGRALGEKLARWGCEFIDPSNMTEPSDRRGNSLGVRVYQAYSCSFGFLRNEVGTAGLTLTVDLRAKVVRTMSVLDHLSGSRSPDKYTPNPHEQGEAKRHWIGQVVISIHDKKCYAVTDLNFAHSAVSMPVEGLGMSHSEYFEKRKGIKLKFPHATPMIAVLGRRNNIIHLPPELVAGNELEKRVKEHLPVIASFSPEQKNVAIDKIRAYLDPRKKSSSGSGLLPALGIQLADERLSAKAQVLPIPRMIAAGIEIPKQRGSNWATSLNKADFRVSPGEANDLQVILVANQEIRNPERIFEKIRNLVNSMNSTFRFSQEPVEIITVGQEEQHWGPVEKSLSEESRSTNVFVLDFNKPRGGTDPAYHVIKRMLAQHGYLSQFLNFRNHALDEGEIRDDDKRSNIIFQGVARQIIQKTGTRLWWVHVPRSLPTPAMFVGVDVFHAPRVYDPKLKRKVAPGSCAAIIVQIHRGGDQPDQSQIELFTKTYAREPGKEFDLGKSLEETLQTAIEELNVSPKCCIVWRDGIGDQSFDTHAKDEITGIRNGLRRNKVVGASAENADIPLSYIVCQKRIDTKLFIKGDESQTDGKYYGAPAGTLVRSIQGLQHDTFYINGTAPSYSTAKPVRYVVVAKDGSIEPVPLDELTWELCHDYANWPGPIKVPSVVQMAHKLAELGGGFSDCGASIDARKFKNKLHFL